MSCVRLPYRVQQKFYFTSLQTVFINRRFVLKRPTKCTVVFSSVSRNVDRGRGKVWSRKHWWGGRGRGKEEGSPPLVMRVQGCNPRNLFDNLYVVHVYMFSTHFVVKFMSLVVAFKDFIERKIWVQQHL